MMFGEGAPSWQRVPVRLGLRQADAMIHVVAIPTQATDKTEYRTSPCWPATF
jgi:hypothetical protein